MFINSSYGGGVIRGGDSQSYITNCMFQNNEAKQYGILILIGSTELTNCKFLNNRAEEGGAILILMPETSIATITDCVFYNNSAQFGGAISILSKGTVHIATSSFVKNNALVGAAIHARSDRPVVEAASVILLCSLTLVDVIIKENYCSCGDYNDTRGGAMYFSGVNVDIGGSDTGSQIVSNSPQGAFQGIDVSLQLWGRVTFINNSGENGGAISLLNNVQLFFLANCTVTFVGNTASRFGGAIYIEGERKRVATPSDVAIGFEIFSYCVMTFHYNYNITFQGNHAELSGHSVYATPLYHCQYPLISRTALQLIQNKSIFHYVEFAQGGSLAMYQDQFNIMPAVGDSFIAQIVSFPENVLICGGEAEKIYSHNSVHYHIQMYPGGVLRLNLSSVDYSNVFTPSAVYAQIKIDGFSNATTNIKLGAQQNVQWIGEECSTVEYQIYGPDNATFNILLSSYPGNAPMVIEITFLPCIAGLTLRCICSDFFTSLGIICDATHGTVTREGTNWIGVYNDGMHYVPALSSTCPLNYCKNIDKVSLIRPGDLCNGGRTGILCGHCSDGQSVVFGSSGCQECSDQWLITILMYAGLGASLVAVLFILNFTVTQGTFYGLIFYANIIQANTTIFFNQSVLRPLEVIISFINLDLGFPLCFYDGMDDAAKTGLQFVFPTYLLILTITVIVVCHYCLRHSTENRHCFDKPSYIVGQRAVDVLCTLIYLSYSKLLRTVIDIFTYSTLHFPDGSVLVWFFDGHLRYLGGKHIILFVIAMAICVVFLLPYTLGLTFVPIIERYSEHNKLFSFLHRLANRIKPVNDTYFASYKGEWRFWLGARLWLLVFMYSLNPLYSSDQPSLLLFIQAAVLTVFMLIQAELKPFGESIQGIDGHYRKTHILNRLYNWLDMFYMLNYMYVILAQSVSYILYHDLHTSKKNLMDTSVGILVGLYGLLLVATVLYHVAVTILKICMVYDTVKEKVSTLIFPTQIQYRPIELDDPTEDHYDNSCLREPLSESM